MKRLLLILNCFFFALLTVSAGDYVFSKPLGEPFLLEVPRIGIPDKYTEIDADWSINGIEYVNILGGGGRYDDYINLRGVKAGKVEITCTWEWEIPIDERTYPYSPTPTEHCTWYITIGDGPDPDPGDGLKDGDTFTADTEEGVSLKYEVISAANKTCEVTKNEGISATKVTIPKTVNGYSVIAIGSSAFEYWSALKTISIPNSVTSIKGSAFWGCSGLTSITIPNSVTSIRGSAFSGCSGLTSITIPNSVTSIGDNVFRGCAITSVTIPNSVTSIGINPFEDCSSLTSIKVESGNNKYDSRNNCNAIITTSSNHLISGCKNTTIPNSVVYIDMWAFNGCKNLTSISIPNSVTYIGTYAFYGCSSLASITIPNSVTEIGSYVFQNCYGLTSITLPNSLTEIGNKVFSYCTHLTDVYCYAQSVPNTPGNAFQYSNISNATLHVPATAVNAYKAVEPWKNFKKIVALTTSIMPISKEQIDEPTYYTIDGKRLDAPQKGLNIVRMGNGTTKKVVIK